MEKVSSNAVTLENLGHAEIIRCKVISWLNVNKEINVDLLRMIIGYYLRFSK